MITWSFLGFVERHSHSERGPSQPVLGRRMKAEGRTDADSSLGKCLRRKGGHWASFKREASKAKKGLGGLFAGFGPLCVYRCLWREGVWRKGEAEGTRKELWSRQDTEGDLEVEDWAWTGNSPYQQTACRICHRWEQDVHTCQLLFSWKTGAFACRV